jgi:ureidoacrylate peracid hydrolase
MTGTSQVAIIRPLSSNGPPGYGHELRLEPTRTAVVVVDVQRYFVESLPFEGMRRAIRPIARFLPIARAGGIVVVHVKSEFRADMADAGRPGSRTRQMMDSVGHGLAKGSGGAEIVPELAPLPEDLVVVKRRFSGFADTELHALLAARGIETLVFAGGTTTVCVESTLRDAVFHDYNPLLLSDCTADMSDELHASAVARIDAFFGWVCTSVELAAMLSSDGAGIRAVSG